MRSRPMTDAGLLHLVTLAERLQRGRSPLMGMSVESHFRKCDNAKQNRVRLVRESDLDINPELN